MPSNIEIKAKVGGLDAIRSIARRIATEPCQTLHQEDVFFRVGMGRLKLRIFSDNSGELIHYERPDTRGAKQSDYLIHGTCKPLELRRLLTNALGESVTVKKKREVYMAGQTRIHLDEVDGLGSFIELEVLLSPNQPPEEGRSIASDVMEKLGIQECDLVPCAYADLILQRAEPAHTADAGKPRPLTRITFGTNEEMTETLVQPYNLAWPSHFQEIEAFLESGVVGVDCTIEHVGSTAIPGMVAKPIIDIDIVIARGAFPKVKERLEALGYVHQGDLGVPEREAFDLVDAEAGTRFPEHHLYVCEEGVHELRKHLAFRDFMRQHPEWRERLNRLKRELCVKHNNDRQAYIDGKAAMVEEITKLAMESPEQMRGEAN